MKKENFRDGIDEMDKNEKKRKKHLPLRRVSNRKLKNKGKESLEMELTKWTKTKKNQHLLP